MVEGWLLDVLGLPATASVGFVTGAQMANATCLAAARNTVLERAGWDVVRDGLIGAPPLTIVAGEEAHATIFTALRFIGLGMDTARLVAVDSQGAIDPDALELDGPAIVCAQAGNVNSGACDPLDAIADACSRGRRLAARRRRVRPVGRGEPVAARARARASSAPTRGPPTPTSGSTSPTTAAWRSSPTAPPTSARWASRPPT